MQWLTVVSTITVVAVVCRSTSREECRDVLDDVDMVVGVDENGQSIALCVYIPAHVLHGVVPRSQIVIDGRLDIQRFIGHRINE